jgi:hypothetical protein
MCLTCGYKLPHDDHGKPEYLTIDDLEASAKLDRLTLDEAMRNLAETVAVARREKEHAHR